ncbi:MAG: response regulator transcription factor [Glutamicibacter arilaitensis]|uniref:response regulator transcription factor n=2 Tax=Glutamicibacter arilaitensis TaxID=256701 RepID=UPI003FCFAC7F
MTPMSYFPHCWAIFSKPRTTNVRPRRIFDDSPRMCVLWIWLIGLTWPTLADMALSQADLNALHTKLRDIARMAQDPELSSRPSTASTMQRYGQGPAPNAIDVPAILSPRELDVISHPALGKRSALIATQMGLAESTIKSYLASAVRKLGASNRFDVVLRARSRGLIPWRQASRVQRH